MNILVNGKRHDVSAVELIDVLNELGYLNAVIAIAVNGEFIPINVRARICIAESDHLEIVAPMQGG